MASPSPRSSLSYEAVRGERAVDSWPGPQVRLFNNAGVGIIALPLLFALKGGLTTWRLLGEALDPILVDDSDTSVPLLWKVKGGKLINVDQLVHPGDYEVLWSLADEDNPPPPIVPSFSTGSTASARSETGSGASVASSQGSFRAKVVERDGACVVSGVREYAEAAHLVPKGDSLAYELAHQSRAPVDAFSKAAGVLLWVPLQRMYDAYDAAFLPKVGSQGETTFRWHLFVLPQINADNEDTVQLLRNLHGRTRTWRDGAPSPELALVHYKRVLGKRFALVRRVMGPLRTPTPIKRKRSTPDHDATPRKETRVSDG